VSRTVADIVAGSGIPFRDRGVPQLKRPRELAAVPSRQMNDAICVIAADSGHHQRDRFCSFYFLRLREGLEAPTSRFCRR
jgi:hypothetical protein